MKHTRLPGFFALGFLAFLLQGCFNPITAVPPQQAGLADPFTVDIVIGGDGQGRALAGPDAIAIKGKTDGESIRNIIQLVVVDTEDQEIFTVIEK
ncbi:MAG: hypothetical protein LBF74_04455, partial [Treponema sp.]|nr:hypothetical protein [Treponema sp.]